MGSRHRSLVILASTIAFAAIAPPLARASAPRPTRVEPHASFAPPAARAPEVISPGAARRLDALGAGSRAVLWVFFTDKDLRDRGDFARSVRAAGNGVTDKARVRRARETGGRFVPDYYDVPVPSAYVDGVAATGARVRHASKWLNAVSVEADRGEAARIAALPYVRRVAPARESRRVKALSEGPAPPRSAPEPLTPRGEIDSASPEGGIRRAYESLVKPTSYGAALQQLTDINVPAAHDSGWSAATVFLGVFDTGFEKANEGLSPLRRIGEYDFIFGDGETANQAPDVPAQWNHGTGCWSVAGGYSVGFVVGPAYNAGFLLAKTEDTRSETPIEEDNWVAAAEWADSLGADVITSSLAYFDFDGASNDYAYTDLDGYTTVVAMGAIFASRRGIVVANAMGNEGSGISSDGSLWSPADAESILSVGAVFDDNTVAFFSSRGPTADGRIKPEVVAQGVETAWLQPGSKFAGVANGTSLSTPLIAGGAALVREAHPEWTATQVREALKSTADNSLAPNNDRGWGRIDVVKAIYGSSFGPPVSPKPFVLLSPAHNTGITNVPVTFRWRKPTDPQGGPITYTLNLYRLGPDSLVASLSAPDTVFVYNGYLGPSKTYEWHVIARDAQGNPRESKDRFRFTTSPTTGAIGTPPPAPPQVVLYQNRPNPFRSGETSIDYSFEGPSGVVPVTMRIFDPQGRLVRTLVNRGEPVPMRCTADWDGRDENGRHVASGIYYYRLEVAGKVYSKRLVLLR